MHLFAEMRHECAGWKWHAVVGIKIRAAAHPPSAAEHGDEAVVRMEVRTAEMVSFQPFVEHNIKSGLRRVAYKDRILRTGRARGIPPDLVGQLIDERRRIEFGRMPRHAQHKRETCAKYQPLWVSCHFVPPVYCTCWSSIVPSAEPAKAVSSLSARRFDRRIMRSAQPNGF